MLSYLRAFLDDTQYYLFNYESHANEQKIKKILLVYSGLNKT
jgi:hypothetical protein